MPVFFKRLGQLEKSRQGKRSRRCCNKVRRLKQQNCAATKKNTHTHTWVKCGKRGRKEGLERIVQSAKIICRNKDSRGKRTRQENTDLALFALVLLEEPSFSQRAALLGCKSQYSWGRASRRRKILETCPYCRCGNSRNSSSASVCHCYAALSLCPERPW